MSRPPLVDWFKGHPVIAALASLIFPGIPHILMGEIGIGLTAFILAAICYYTYYMGWLIGVFAAVHAYRVCVFIYGRG